MDKTDETRPILRARLQALSDAAELRPPLVTGLYQSGFQTVDQSLEQARAVQLCWLHRQLITELLNGELAAGSIGKLRKESDKFIAQAFMFSWVDPAVMSHYRACMDAVEVELLVEETVNAWS